MRQLAILLLLGCTACATQADGHAPAQAGVPPASKSIPAQPAPPAAGSDTLSQIQALVGQAGCTSDEQCKVLPIGAKACGGPASYLAYSAAQIDTTQLHALAVRYHAEQQEANQRSGRVSTCQVVPVPAAACRANACQLTQSTAAVR